MEQFGRYVLVQQVGRGGMAEVHRAFALGAAGFSRQVAVKRILEHLNRVRDFVDMFVDEARIASVLHHPNVLPVLDLGVERGNYFMVMEFVAGASLRSVLGAMAAQGRAPRDALALHVAVQVLAALEYAHTRRDPAGTPLGIVHRDVSPHNVMLGFDGRVMLGDFGIARARHRLVHTVTGGVKGKYGYMAPEQALGTTTDHRADLYAVGVMLYEALSLRKFRTFQDGADIVRRVTSGAHVPLSRLRPRLAPQVLELVERAVAVAPAERFDSAASFSAAVMAAVRALDAPMDGAGVAALMGELLPDRRAAEEDAAARFADLAQQLAATEDPAVRAALAGDPSMAHLVGDTLTGTGSFASLAPAPEPAPDLPDEATGPALLADYQEPTEILPLPVAPEITQVTAAAPPSEARTEEQPAPTITTEQPSPPSASPLVAPVSPASPPARKRSRAMAALLGAGVMTALIVMLLPDNPPPPAVPPATPPPAATTPRGPAPPTTAPAAAPTSPPTPEPAEPVTATPARPAPVPADEPPPPEAPTAPVEPARQRPTPTPRKAPEPARLPPRRRAPEERPAAAAGSGFLSVQSYPWARIRIDGKDLGVFTPLVKHALPAGPHVLELHNDEDNIHFTTRITIKDGEVTRLAKHFR